MPTPRMQMKAELMVMMAEQLELKSNMFYLDIFQKLPNKIPYFHISEIFQQHISKTNKWYSNS